MIPTVYVGEKCARVFVDAAMWCSPYNMGCSIRLCCMLLFFCWLDKLHLQNSTTICGQRCFTVICCCLDFFSDAFFKIFLIKSSRHLNTPHSFSINTRCKSTEQTVWATLGKFKWEAQCYVIWQQSKQMLFWGACERHMVCPAQCMHIWCSMCGLIFGCVKA